MNFDINLWMKEYSSELRKIFGNRIWFVGLQGSYGRNEATEQSDIDAVVILDKVTLEDIKAYSALLDRLPYREKACGFISGKQELLNWEKSDLFQFYYDTLPIIGSLNSLKEYFTAADVRRAIRIGACNIYHGCMHNMVHEKSWELLKGLYKSAAFTLQAAGFLLPEDQAILLIGQTLKNTNLTERKEFERLSATLLSWASDWIVRCGTTQQQTESSADSLEP